MTEAVVRYLHFIAIIVFASMLVAEHVLLKVRTGRDDMRRLAIIDAVYGLSALVVLLAGLSLWFWVGKPAEFYSANPVFLAKVAAFIVMALLSIAPTLFFIRQRRSSAGTVEVPKILINLIRAELLLLVVIPLLAVLMARGHGLS